MAYDSARGVSILFGGTADGIVGDTWEWDGTAWIQTGQSGPSPRTGHAMVYDDLRGVAVLFGGDARERDGQTWEYLYQQNPCPRDIRIKSAKCTSQDGSYQLKVVLAGGLPGDSFIARLSDGSEKSGTINERGRAKAKLNDRMNSESGEVTVVWNCGAHDALEYHCH